ncbi:MAG: hypothetical protein OH338_04855 [Candidatus Parvarchaeota archaeon]|nr:hypothetical protein [Candidatus Parvarchaeum tengchongense]
MDIKLKVVFLIFIMVALIAFAEMSNYFPTYFNETDRQIITIIFVLLSILGMLSVIFK